MASWRAHRLNVSASSSSSRRASSSVRGDQVAGPAASGAAPSASAVADQPPVRLAQQLVGVGAALAAGRRGRCRYDGQRDPGQQVRVVELGGRSVGRLVEDAAGLLALAGVVELAGRARGDPDPPGRRRRPAPAPAGSGRSPPRWPAARRRRGPPPRSSSTALGRLELGAGEVGVAGEVGREQPARPAPASPVERPGPRPRAGARRSGSSSAVVEGLADQVVGEREPAAARRDARAGRSPPGRAAGRPGGRGERRRGGEHLPVELLAEHGRRGQQLDHRRRAAAASRRPHRVAHAGRRSPSASRRPATAGPSARRRTGCRRCAGAPRRPASGVGLAARPCGRSARRPRRGPGRSA